MPFVLKDLEASLGSGSPDAAITGSKTAAPGGVESVFEYNGLYMNVIDNIDKYIVTSIDGLDDADVIDSRETNPSGHGETPFESSLGGRGLNLTVKVEAHTLHKLRDMEQALRTAFTTFVEHPLYIHLLNTQQSVRVNCKKNNKLSKSEIQKDYNFSREWLVPLRASNPRFISTRQKQFNRTLTQDAHQFTLQNAGNFEAEPIFIITGQAQDVTVRNLTTGKFFTINGIIPPNDRRTYDVSNDTFEDKNGITRYTELGIVSEEVFINGGENQFEVLSRNRAESPSFTVTWRDTWV